jgi:RNA polymerase sigma factor (sigma-70 family)
MRATHADPVMREVRHLLGERALTEWTDVRLLEQFVRCRDEAAFAALLHRHGPMVLSVCRGVLHDAHDTEDAFQATFLILACRGHQIRKQSSLASFLHGTAYRVALRARAKRARRQVLEKETARMRTDHAATGDDRSTWEGTLHEELARLPERYRRLLVLCHLEGRTHEQAARDIGCPPGSVSRHLRRACELLRERLVARGVAAPAAGALVVALALPGQAALPPALAGATLRTVGRHAAGTLASAADVPAVALAQEVLRTMKTFRLCSLGALALLIGLTGTALLAGRAAEPADKGSARSPQPARAPEKRTPRLAHTDLHGDPLPPGASARLGTVRLRSGTHLRALAFSPDGRVLATTADDSLLRLWQVSSGREVGRLQTQRGTVNPVAFAPDGKSLATMSTDGALVTHEVSLAPPGGKQARLGKERWRIKASGGPLVFLGFRPDGSLVGGAADGRVRLWDATGKELRGFGKPAVREYHFALSADGKRVAVADGRGVATGFNPVVTVWDVDRGVTLARLPVHQQLRCLAFAPDGKTLAVGEVANTLRLWNLTTKPVTATSVGVKAPGQTRGSGNEVSALAFTPDGRTLVSLGDYGAGSIRLWEVLAGKERCRLQGQPGDGSLLAVSPDGRTLAVTGMNQTVRLWDMIRGKPLDAARGTQGSVYAAAVAPDSKEVATAGSDGWVRLWDRATGKELRSFRAYDRQVTALEYLPGERRLLATVGASRLACLWDTATGKEVRSSTGSLGSVRGVCYLRFSPDGKKVVLTTAEPAVQVVDVATGKVERTLAKALIVRVAWSPDGKGVAAAGWRGLNHMVQVWDPATGQEKWSVQVDTSIAALTFSPDGSVVAAGTYNRAVLLWGAASGKALLRLGGGGRCVRAVAISPDSRLLAASGDNSEVVLYELATGQLLQRLAGHEGITWALAFAPDGRSLVSGSCDATALVWDLTGQGLARKQGEQLSAARLEERWAALGSNRAEEAYRAVLSLANVPRQAVPLLRRRLLGSVSLDAGAVARWLKELESNRFAVREAASRELARLGKAVRPELLRARAATQSQEVRRRLDDLLGKIAAKGLEEGLGPQRVVAVLELAATAEARELLKQLASKGATEELRRRAGAAGERLRKRP